MWHVADGDLHAYLDGALSLYPGEEAERIRMHLERCEECRRRLEEEELVRERAGEVLARTEPGESDPPPFEDVLRRARAGREQGQPASPIGRLTLRLGWAATVVLALGLGWVLGRGGVADGPSVARLAPATVDVTTERVSPSDEAAAVPARALERRAAGSATDQGRLERARFGDSSAEEATVEVAAVDTTDLTAAVPESATASTSGAVAAAVPTAISEPTSADRAAAAPKTGFTAVSGRVIDANTGAPLRGAQIMLSGTTTGTLSGSDGRFRLASVPAGEQTLRAQLIGYGAVERTVNVGAGAGGTPLDFALESRAVALEGSVVTALGVEREERSGFAVPSAVAVRELGRADTLAAARALQQAVAEFEETAAGVTARTLADSVGAARRAIAERAVSPSTLTLPGLEVVDLRWTEVAPGVRGLLVVQRLAGDTTALELRFVGLDGGVGAGERNEDQAASFFGPLPEGIHQVVAPLSGRRGWVALRARLPESRLERLLDLLR